MDLTKEEEKHYCIDMVNFAEFVIEMIGEDNFFAKIPTLKRQYVKKGFENFKFILSIAELIDDTFSEAWRESYDNYEEVDEKPDYVPFEEREPLTRKFLMTHYWHLKKTTEEIASELNVPDGWVNKEIRRLSMQKKKNGIKLKGRKGYVMPEDERAKHRAQPHAKPVVQICPETFKVVKEYTSTGAVERHGFRRENVRKAIRQAGLHNGYLWAHKGMEAPIINSAKNRGTLERKLQASKVVKPTKAELKRLYIDQNMTQVEIASIIGCNPTTVAVYAAEYGLKKRTGKKVSKEKLKHLYMVKKMDNAEIGKELGLTEKSVATYISKYGIKRSA